MNERTLINSIYLNLWAPKASLLRGLIVLQMKFRNVREVKKRLVQPGLVWTLEQNIIDTAINKWRKRLLACVCIVANTLSNFAAGS